MMEIEYPVDPICPYTYEQCEFDEPNCAGCPVHDEAREPPADFPCRDGI